MPRSTRRWTARWRPRSTASISSASARRPDTRRRPSSPTPTTRRRRRSRSVRVSIPVGEYDYNATGVSFLTHSSRPVSVEGQLLSGGFYDGERTSGNLTLRIRPNRFLRSETTAEINDVDAGGGQFRVEGLPAAPGDGGDAAGCSRTFSPSSTTCPSWPRSTPGSAGTTVPDPTSSLSTTSRGMAPASAR